MKKGLEPKNLPGSRRTVLEGNQLVSSNHLDVFSQQAVNWPITGLRIDNRMNAQVLYKGDVQNSDHCGADPTRSKPNL